MSGCDNPDHLFKVMKALALFHAKWWDHPGGKKPLKWALVSQRCHLTPPPLARLALARTPRWRLRAHRCCSSGSVGN